MKEVFQNPIFIDVLEARQSAKNAIKYACSWVPRELLESFGLKTARLMGCGTPSHESAGERKLSGEVCSFCKTITGAPGSGAPVIGCTSCDQMRRLSEIILSERSDAEFMVNVPKTCTDNSRELYRSEIRALCSHLESLTGESLTDKSSNAGKLKSVCGKRNFIRSELRSLRESLGAVDFHCLVHLESQTDPDFMISYLGRSFKTKTSSKKKTMLAGSPLTLEDAAFLKLLEDSGFEIVFNTTCTGDRSIDFDISIKDDPIADLADSYFNRPPCIWKRPNDSFYSYVSKKILETGATSVIWRSVRYCDLWNIEAQRAKQIINLPMLVLDMNYSDTCSPRTATRVEAFRESLPQ
ncbi:MAG: 2-hydroxyacyl-CoA dehydratase [Caldisericales bacterium]|nr:2-hydroxyacyl-CoA dehydratase [Caldisericales bacterium]